MTPSDFFALAKRLGIRRLCWRMGHELKKPFGGEVRLADFPVTPNLPDHASWLGQLGPSCWPSVVAHRMEEVILRNDTSEALILSADAASQGRGCLFDHMATSGGWPPRWERHPLTGVSWPLWPAGRLLGWMEQGGDIKGMWEMDRQAHVALWLRAARAGGDRVRYGQALREHMESFLAQNPPGLGAHWASGQEHALRWMMWAGGVAGLWQGASALEMLPFWRATWIHGHMLVRGIEFARYASPNNHLVCEVAVLWVMGRSVQAFWPLEAAKWMGLAKKVWGEEAAALFYDDGGFCQGSMNYQRFALEMLLWWQAHLDDGDPIREDIREICGRSLRFFLMAMTKGGRVPNLGANDGAMLWRWTRCEHEDYRPLVQALGVAATGKKPLAAGPWDEGLGWWFGGKEEFRVEPVEGLPRVKVARQSGVVWWRCGEDRVSLRTGPVRGTASQEDVGHVGVGLGGEPVVVDPGSFSYRGHAHKWHAGPAAHNGPTVGGRGATTRLTQFHVAMDAKVSVVRRGEGVEMGWERRGVRVKRHVACVEEGMWRVSDEVMAGGGEDVVWGWVVWGVGWRVKSDGEVWMDRARGIEVRMFASDGARVIQREVVVATRYLLGQPATQFEWRCVSEGRPIFFITEFRRCALS